MASTGDDEAETSALDTNSTVDSPANAGADNDDADLRESRHDRLGPEQVNESDSGSDHGHEHEDSEDDRENRFQGPSSTWRFFTEEERSLVHSLDQQRANDLSLHLYNVHTLKVRLRDSDACSKAKPYNSKKQWITTNDDGSLVWQPPTSWTAWPLPPEDVPRSREKFGVPVVPDGLDSATYKKAEPWKPSGNLEDEVLAIAMRRAKERLRLSNAHQSNVSAEESTDVESLHNQDIQMSGALPADADVEMSDESDESVESVSAKRPAKLAAPPGLDESVLLDDDQAKTLLQPRIRHILSQVDGLLVGLQKSRRGQQRTSSRSRSRSRRSRSTSQAAKSASRSKSRQHMLSEVSSGDESESQASGVDEGAEESGGQPKRQRGLIPRDWSEVLGMAALTGWDPEVVDRAAKRCATLFGEGMNFRTVPLNSIESTKSILKTYDAGTANTSAATRVHQESIMDDNAAENRSYCPIATCSRYGEPFTQARIWREHLKRSHKYGNAQIHAAEKTLADSRKPPGVSGLPNAGANPRAEQRTEASLLRSVNVKMGRWKDKQPRKRKASQPIPIQSNEEEDVEI